MSAANSANTQAVKDATVPAIINEINTAEPALFEATPVSVNTPDPIVLPKPNMIREKSVSVGLNAFFFFLGAAGLSFTSPILDFNLIKSSLFIAEKVSFCGKGD